MLDHAPLIGLMVMGFALAFVFGLIAHKLKLSPIVGYLIAGILIGPFTPGFVADSGLSSQLSEIGVILLMFGVGLHFSVQDLMRVRRIAVPGALLQIAGATLVGALVALSWKWNLAAAIVFGLSLSVSSTVVLLRALESRNILHTQRAQIVVGWLIVEDIATVLVLVLLPVVAQFISQQHSTGDDVMSTTVIVKAMLLTIAKIVLFVVLMLVVGTRLIPKLLSWVAGTRSRELFTLAVLAIALGIAFGSAELFGVSLALGAFFAGVVLSESELSHKAGADILPLQDAFAVLFFVSVGMLFDWHIISQAPLKILAVAGIVVVWKFLSAFSLVSSFGYSVRTSLTVAAGDSQMGEFSFILVGLAVALNLLPREAQTLVLAGSIASIAVNPFVFGMLAYAERYIRSHPRLFSIVDRSSTTLRDHGPVVPADWRGHAVLVGHGRVGSVIATMLEEQGIRYAVVEVDRRIVGRLTERGIPSVHGDIADPVVTASVRLEHAGVLLFAIPDSFQLREALQHIRDTNSGLNIVARTHSHDDARMLRHTGIDLIVMGEQELAVKMGEHALDVLKASK
ncbi:MAG TPA: cation:proton antiporter [Steroidobacteraceae bacterium]|nr:cation:proton antiporter [Steroidobacteraceae bacterium]